MWPIPSPGHEATDPGRRHEWHVIEDRAMKQLELETAGISGANETSYLTSPCITIRCGSHGTSGRAELVGCAVERRSVGDLPSCERKPLCCFGLRHRHSEWPLVDPQVQTAGAAAGHGPQPFGVLSPSLNVTSVDADVAESSNIHCGSPWFGPVSSMSGAVGHSKVRTVESMVRIGRGCRGCPGSVSVARRRVPLRRRGVRRG